MSLHHSCKARVQVLDWRRAVLLYSANASSQQVYKNIACPSTQKHYSLSKCSHSAPHVLLVSEQPSALERAHFRPALPTSPCWQT